MATLTRHPLLATWRELPEGERRELARDIALEVLEQRMPRELEDALARALRFRTATLRRASERGLSAAVMARFAFVEPKDFARILVNVHFGSRASVLSRVYEALGVPHDGAFAEEVVLKLPLDVARVTSAFAQLRAESEGPALRLCLQVMRNVCTEAWRPGVEAALLALGARSLASELESAHSRLTEVAPAEVREEPAAFDEELEGPATLLEGDQAPAPEAPDFTQLDRLLIRAVVSSLNEVEGSVSELERSDLVLEMVHLNESRSQSWFHLGFLDSLEGKPLGEVQKGDNRERRAWYVSGFLHGTHRIKDRKGALDLFAALAEPDRDRLLGTGSEGGALAAELLAPALLWSQDPTAAIPWLRLYAGTAPVALVKPVLSWSRQALLDQAPQRVADILEATLAGLRAGPSSNEAPPDSVVRSLRRRLAIAWRRLRRLGEARLAVEQLLEESPEGDERGRLLCDLALISLGVGSLEDLRLGHPDTRPALAVALRGVRPLLEEAAVLGDVGAVAHYLLGVLGFLEAEGDETGLKASSAAFSRALSSMSTDDPGFWRVTGVQRQCEFLQAVCELRLLDDARAVAAVQQITAALDQGADLPEDLLFEAINCAALLNAPEVSLLVGKLLKRQPGRALRELDLSEVAKRNDGLRELAVEFATEHEESLAAEERWKVWYDLLRAALGATTGRDIEAARRALDALERVAWTSSMTERFLGLLADSQNWECAWEERDYVEARVSALRQLGRWAEAQEEIERIAWQALQRGDSDSMAWVELFREVGGPAETVDALSRGIAASRPVESSWAGDSSRQASLLPVRILFVGGNETQERYEERLVAEFSAAHPGSAIHFEFSNWSSNWGRLVDRLKPTIADYSAMVLMRFVRTELGRELRRQSTTCGVPWVACSGHGFDSLQRALEEAARVGQTREQARLGEV